MRLSDLRCICCGKQMPSSGGTIELDDIPPDGGVVFYTRGNYGSHVYDPGPAQADNEYLVIVICDSCIMLAGEKGERTLVGYGRRPILRSGQVQPAPYTLTRWTPPLLAGWQRRKLERANATTTLAESEKEES